MRLIQKIRFSIPQSAAIFLLLFGLAPIAPSVLHAKNAPVRLRLKSANFSTEELVEGAIEATAISPDGTGIAEEKRFRNIRIPGETVLDLDGDLVWKLHLAGDGIWCRDRVIQMNDRSAELTVWRTGIVKGHARTPRDREDPKVVKARFESSHADGTGASKGPEIAQVTVKCPVEDGIFECELPAASLDLRLRAKGYISHYLWSVAVDPNEPTDLGMFVLRPGASVVGYVAAEGPLQTKQARVHLDPEVAAPARSPAGEEHQHAGRFDTQIDDRGFFQFTGIAPGQYRLSATQPGFAEAALHPVRVLPGSETSLAQPLLLQRPAELEIYLDPPQDPFGQPWDIAVRRFGAIPGILDDVSEGAASSAGEYVASGLTPGRFALQVTDSLGSRFGWQEIDVDRGDPPVFMHLNVLWLEGEVTLGGEALEANLVFGGRNGTVRIPIKADKDGVFGGFLPHGGTWDVFVESHEPEVSKTVSVEIDASDEEDHADVEIALPDTLIRGKVLDARGRAVPGAVVKATEMAQALISWVRSDDEGRFEFSGLAEGPVALDATVTEDLSSDPVVLQVSEHSVPPDVDLVVHRRAKVHGAVVSSQGPVPGTLIIGIPTKGGLEFPFMVRPKAVTDLNGTFELLIPADTQSLQIVALPPGYSLTTFRINGVPKEPVRLPVIEHGGELRLDFESGTGGQTGRDAPSPVVVYDGVILDSAILKQWAQLKLADVRNPAELVVPEMPPGDYQACWVTYGRYAQQFVNKAGQSFPGRACVSGYLSPYGVLDLELDAQESSSEGKTASK